MEYQVVSDLHLDFVDYEYRLPSFEDDRTGTTLLICGDSTNRVTSEAFIDWLEKTCTQFHTVIKIFGNHDYYGQVYNQVPDEFREATKHIENFVFLDNETHEIGGDLIIGSTMWTSFDNGSPVNLITARYGMNDYRYIRYRDESRNYFKITPEIILEENRKSMKFLAETLEANKHRADRTIVMTHHQPSWKLATRADDFTPLYFNDCDEMILEYKPDVWCCGHTHSNKTDRIGSTTIITNCYGYRGYREQGGEFDPHFRFKLKGR